MYSDTMTKNPTTPHMCCYTTWWNVRHCTQAGNDTDLLHDQCWSSLTCGLSLDLNPVDYAVWGALHQVVYQRRQSTSNNQLRQAIVTDWSSRSIWLAASWISGIADLKTSSSSKVDTLNIWCKNCEMWQLL